MHACHLCLGALPNNRRRLDSSSLRRFPQPLILAAGQAYSRNHRITPSVASGQRSLLYIIHTSFAQLIHISQYNVVSQVKARWRYSRRRTEETYTNQHHTGVRQLSPPVSLPRRLPLHPSIPEHKQQEEVRRTAADLRDMCISRSKTAT
jgi:hypothetical protein